MPYQPMLTHADKGGGSQQKSDILWQEGESHMAKNILTSYLDGPFMGNPSMALLGPACIFIFLVVKLNHNPLPNLGCDTQ